MFVRRLKVVLSPPLVLLGAVLFLVEEVLWARLGQLMAAIGRWPPVAGLEDRIRRLPPYVALTLFVLPWAVILPVKLMAVWLVATGHVLSGVLLFVGGEVFGVGFLARLYTLCRPSLATLAWFVRLEGLALRISAWAHGRLERLAGWRQAKQLVHRLVERVSSLGGGGGWLICRLRAARRLVRASR